MKRIAQRARRTPGIVRSALACLIGPLIWSGHFGLVYVAHHVSCRVSADPGSFVTPIVIGATALAMISLGIAALRPHGPIGSKGSPVESSQRAFLGTVMRWLILLSAFGVLWTWTAFLLVRACTG